MVTIDGTEIRYIIGDMGDYFERVDGTKTDHNHCILCGAKVHWISAQDFASYACVEHDPPLIHDLPWCNDETIKFRPLNQFEKEFMKKYPTP